jgi:hypothetical protein
MIRELKIAELPVVAEPGEKDLLVSGAISIERQADGNDIVTVMWHLLEPDGRELGKVEQQNRVVAGSVEGNWGRSAALIARAAAPGIIDLLNKAAPEGS